MRRNEAAAIHEAIHRLGRRGPGVRYPAALRSRVVAYVAAREADGLLPTAVAAELGIPLLTLRRWQSTHRPGFVPVEMAATGPGDQRIDTEHPQRTYTLHGPAGTRVDGLSMAELTELLRRLA